MYFHIRQVNHKVYGTTKELWKVIPKKEDSFAASFLISIEAVKI